MFYYEHKEEEENVFDRVSVLCVGRKVSGRLLVGGGYRHCLRRD